MNAITTSDKPLNVGLIGYGLGGATFHAPFIAITPGLHLSAVMTSDPARRAVVAERYPDARLASDLNELLAGTPRLDLLAISSPNATHFPLASAALEAGAHVVVDKPFAATAAQAREIEALAARVGRSAIPFRYRAFWVDYGRPLARGRVLDGIILPYDRVWCTGANAATQFSTSQPIMFAGLRVPAGKYTLWTVPREKGGESSW